MSTVPTDSTSSERAARAARRARARRRDALRVVGTAVLAGMFVGLWAVIGSNALALSPFVAAGVAGGFAAAVVAALVTADIRRARGAEPVALERVIISRKTPRDGRLEVSAATSAQLEPLGSDFDVTSLGEQGSGTRESLECRCAKGAGERHVHHFVVSELFRSLVPNSDVRIVLDTAARELRVEPVEQQYDPDAYARPIPRNHTD